MEPLACVGDDIQLLGLLGRGGMGTVWLGRRKGALVAVKMMLPSLAALPHAVARFEREQRILAGLRTRHAVHLLGCGRHEGQPYAVMERIDGTSLAERFETRGAPPRGIAVELVRELLVAVREIHAEGVIHRDVTPGNVMVGGTDEAPQITLIDFGVASSRTEPAVDPMAGVTVGTAPYMSPEQLVDGGVATPYEDMWATAVVAYEALLGRLPFAGRSYASICVAVTSGVFVPPTAISPALRGPVDRFFARAFARRVADRFGDIAAMAEAWDVATASIDTPTSREPWRTRSFTSVASHVAASRARTRPVSRRPGLVERMRHLRAWGPWSFFWTPVTSSP